MTGLWTTHDGRSLHESLGDSIRAARRRGPCPGFRIKPGTHFTDGEHLYEVVYGVQGLGARPAGWVAGVRTDYIDNGPPEDCERYCYSLFGWTGTARDGVIIGGHRRPVILRVVLPAPRLGVTA